MIRSVMRSAFPLEILHLAVNFFSIKTLKSLVFKIKKNRSPDRPEKKPGRTIFFESRPDPVGSGRIRWDPARFGGIGPDRSDRSKVPNFS